jgi:transcriptional regulator of acetoin/glycerol metabolism
VGAYAAAIENRLFITQSSEHLVIRFQIDSSLLDSNHVALAGVDSAGRLAWMNGTASRLLGLPPTGRPASATSVEAVLGNSLTHLASLPRSGAGLLHLANGLMVWARCEMRAPDGHRDFVRGAGDAFERTGESVPSDVSVPLDPSPTATDPEDGAEAEKAAAQSSPTHIEPPSAEIPIKLKDGGKDLIERTLESCGGNVSKAAELLGVSRGLIYRRLRSGERSTQ